MSNYEYVADCYDPFDLELKHWKYIKKYKHNGKWVYVYDDELDNKYSDNITEANVTETVAYNKNGGFDLGSKYNKISSNKTSYKDSDRLFSKTTTNTTTKKSDALFKKEKEVTETVITKERGKIERAAAKGEKWLYDNIFKKIK